jgi:hypothetical protein
MMEASFEPISGARQPAIRDLNRNSVSPMTYRTRVRVHTQYMYIVALLLPVVVCMVAWKIAISPVLARIKTVVYRTFALALYSSHSNKKSYKKQ